MMVGKLTDRLTNGGDEDADGISHFMTPSEDQVDESDSDGSSADEE